MLVAFDTLPLESRVWVYQSNKELNTVEIDIVSTKLEGFIATWKRHGEDLKASFKIVYNQFIVLAVDESFNDVSGCSIDASVHFMQEIEKELQLDLMDKMKIAFKIGETINIVLLPDFKGYATSGKITSETIVFNNMVQSLGEFNQKWEVPAANSWHNRFFKSTIS